MKLNNPPITIPDPRPRKRARAVIRAMQRELRRQVEQGTLLSCGTINENGHLVLEGLLDLPMLAFVTELAIVQEFGF